MSGDDKDKGGQSDGKDNSEKPDWDVKAPPLSITNESYDPPRDKKEKKD